MTAGRHKVPHPVAAHRIDALASLPVFWKLKGQRAVVCGGGMGAVWKAELLAAAGALVDVYDAETPDLFASLAQNPPAGAVHVFARSMVPDDLIHAAFAIGSFEDETPAQHFVAAAQQHGVPFNVIDRPHLCTVQFGSIINRSPLLVAISTDGAAPVFAQALRAKIEALLPVSFKYWMEKAQQWRARLKARHVSFADRRRFWELFSAQALANSDQRPDDPLYDRLLLQTHVNKPEKLGRVLLVGAGPGDPDLLTLKALRALQQADVILFDDLVSKEVLNLARREAQRIAVGKRGQAPSCKQDDINALMVKLALEGHIVVRLKSGDPAIFGRAGEEIAACQQAGVAVSLISGISAAQAAAARLTLSLTHRDHAQRLQFITGHAKNGDLPHDLAWNAVADPHVTTVVYMPKRTLGHLRDGALAAGLSPTTPAMAIFNITGENERCLHGTISTLPEQVAQEACAGAALVLIGSALSELQKTDLNDIIRSCKHK